MHWCRCWAWHPWVQRRRPRAANNDTAKACQQGAWRNLVSESGELFKNQGDCVNDGAQSVLTWGAAGRAACQAIPGYLRDSFSIDSATVWSCEYIPGSNPPNDEYTAALAAACLVDAGVDGSLPTGPDAGGYWLATCIA